MIQPHTLLPHEILPHTPELEKAMPEASDVGHSFVANGIGSLALEAMVHEANSLSMEEGDHIASPIYAGTKKEIRQLHDRSYHAIGDDEVPFATKVTRQLAVHVRQLSRVYPELKEWMATEAGYQLYKNDPEHDYHISRHRDRRNDHLLSATITVTGSALVKMYEPINDPDDYTDENMCQIDEHITLPGDIMFLRAPGLNTGVQTIHEVLPPRGNDDRLILNLRMRDDILPAPEEV